MNALGNFATLRVIVLLGMGGVAASGQTPEVVLHPISSIPESVPLSIRPHTTNWVLLERSSDLATWHPVANVLTTNRTVPFVDYPGSNVLVRFYRARSPGVSTAGALSSWQTNEPVHYRYSFQTVKFDASRAVIFKATVTISNTVKTVTNVTANDFPTATFEPVDFLTPDEVFNVILDVEARGVRLAHVTYDERRGFPATVMVLHGTGIPMTDYRISEFTELPMEMSLQAERRVTNLP